MRNGVAVVVDQALSSASNFLLVLVVMRTTGVADLGSFAIAFAVLTLGLGLVRSNVGVPLGTDLHRLGDHDRRELVSRSLAVSLTVALVVGLLVALLGWILTTGGTRHALLVLGATAPLVFAQDLGRYVLLADARPWRAAVGDGAWTLVALVGLAATALGEPGGPARAATTWVVGAAVGLLVVSGALVPPRWSGTPRWFAADSRRAHLSLDAAIGAGTPLLVFSGVSALTGTATVGVLRAASTLMTPVNVLIAATGVGVVAEASRRDPLPRRRLIRRVSLGLVAVTAAWGALLLLLPEALGRELAGASWQAARVVLPLTVVEFVALAVWTGAITALRVDGLTARALRGRVGYASLAVVLAVTAAAFVGTPLAVQAAMAVAAVLVAVVAWLTTPGTRRSGERFPAGR